MYAEVDGMSATITVTDRDGGPVKHIEKAGAVYVSGEVSAEWDHSTSQARKETAIDKSVESLREHWANRTICMGEDEVAPFDDGEWEYLKALKLVSVQPPHAPATPPPEG